MKLALLQASVLVVAVVVTAAGLYVPVQQAWGAVGLHSIAVSAIISLIAALAGGVPLTLVAVHRPKYAGPVAFAGTAVRLLVTATLAVLYHVTVGTHLTSFLTCLTVFYLVLLAVETVLAVVLVRRTLVRPTPGQE